MGDRNSRTKRKELEKVENREQQKQKFKDQIKDRYEEFKLNRQGKTKRRRSEVMEKYRRLSRILTLLIVIMLLLLIIVWIWILYF